MITKAELLKDEEIKIKSYNYEESKGFSQETAVDQVYGTYKEHKFVISIEDQDYSLEFLHSYVVNKYAAMEDEWVKSDTVLEDGERLTIEKIEKQYPYSYDERVVIKDLNKDIEEFKNKLIKAAKELGIGCNHSNHRNREDDFGRVASDIENKAPYLISDKVLFIEEEENEWFEEYLSLDTNEKEKDFLNNLKNLIENKKQEEKEKEDKIKEKKANLVNPLLHELMEKTFEICDLESYMESKPKDSEYTMEEVQKEIDNLEEGDDIDYYHEKMYHLGELKDEIKKINEINSQILKHISKEELEYSLKNNYSYIDYDIEEDLQHYEEPEFEYKEDWIYAQYNTPKTIEERFEAIKKYIKNEIKKDMIPNELKEKFNIKNEVTDFLNNKINEKQPDNQLKRKNKL